MHGSGISDAIRALFNREHTKPWPGGGGFATLIASARAPRGGGRVILLKGPAVSIHLIREIRKVQKYILNEGAIVEDAMRQAVHAMEQRDPALAKQVVAGDKQIDLMELEVEEACLSLLALHQPVAHDLRYVIASLKINHDLERIGDLASNIAQQAIALADVPELPIRALGLPDMMQRTQGMLKKVLDAYINLDAEAAQEVRDEDDRVDELHAAMYDQVEAKMREQPDRIDAYIRVLITARQIERAADHACSIAKDVIYMITGEIVRHGKKQKDLEAREQAHEILAGPRER